MTAPVVAAVLVAALLHATWNTVAHSIGDRLLGFALIGTVSLGARMPRANSPVCWWYRSAS